MPSIIHNLQFNNQGIRKMTAFELAVFAELFVSELFKLVTNKYVISKPSLFLMIIHILGLFVNFSYNLGYS